MHRQRQHMLQSRHHLVRRCIREAPPMFGPQHALLHNDALFKQMCLLRLEGRVLRREDSRNAVLYSIHDASGLGGIGAELGQCDGAIGMSMPKFLREQRRVCCLAFNEYRKSFDGSGLTTLFVIPAQAVFIS